MPTVVDSGIHAVAKEKTLVYNRKEHHFESEEVRELGLAKLGTSRYHDAGVDTAGDQGDKRIHRDIRFAIAKAARVERAQQTRPHAVHDKHGPGVLWGDARVVQNTIWLTY